MVSGDDYVKWVQNESVNGHYLFFSQIPGYGHNPYHNWCHAVDVMQSVFSLLTEAGGAGFLLSVERLAILLAALGHDLEHPVPIAYKFARLISQISKQTMYLLFVLLIIIQGMNINQISYSRLRHSFTMDICNAILSTIIYLKLCDYIVL